MKKYKLKQLQTLLDEARSEMFALARHTKTEAFAKFLRGKGEILTIALDSLPCLEEEQQ